MPIKSKYTQPNSSSLDVNYPQKSKCTQNDVYQDVHQRPENNIQSPISTSWLLYPDPLSV